MSALVPAAKRRTIWRRVPVCPSYCHPASSVPWAASASDGDLIRMQVELVPHLFGTNHRPTGQRGLYMIFRNSSKLVDANAARVLLGLA